MSWLLIMMGISTSIGNTIRNFGKSFEKLEHEKKKTWSTTSKVSFVLCFFINRVPSIIEFQLGLIKNAQKLFFIFFTKIIKGPDKKFGRVL